MSYSSEKKEQLAALPVKRICCRKALLYGLLFPQNSFDSTVIEFTTDSRTTRDLVAALFDQCFGLAAEFSNDKGREEGNYALLGFVNFDYDEAVKKICEEYFSEITPSAALIKCESCRVNFMKGVFISSGRITDPEKSLHLEFVFQNKITAQGMKEYFTELGLSPKEIDRRGNCGLYFKRQDEIEDFLATMGDSQGAMQIMNIAIMRSLRNNANRYSNCDAANLYKATEAASLQIQAINRLIESGVLETLSEDLKMTAKLRVAQPELTLAELGEAHTPPITKSGVNHRLQKLIKIASIGKD
ncbi:MAG: DNA-binding protein WhiA [Clostridia bacterium]|nr:DNA-binding protein WhiA [Clostridia bacterium]